MCHLLHHKLRQQPPLRNLFGSGSKVSQGTTNISFSTLFEIHLTPSSFLGSSFKNFASCLDSVDNPIMNIHNHGGHPSFTWNEDFVSLLYTLWNILLRIKQIFLRSTFLLPYVEYKLCTDNIDNTNPTLHKKLII